ncbi:hypothetical protein BD626DRAFT_279950 [Schizophyllum amplum]|uniref:Uncharacterized protein n=1 Tax=Schizophyllum amplum TaxID=97359 RepID=A0A550BTB2_9AGAR|nr:hypothetical protein BD626DRAFT_279950 [Auriculariopsis ampla]
MSSKTRFPDVVETIEKKMTKTASFRPALQQRPQRWPSAERTSAPAGSPVWTTAATTARSWTTLYHGGGIGSLSGGYTHVDPTQILSVGQDDFNDSGLQHARPSSYGWNASSNASPAVYSELCIDATTRKTGAAQVCAT